MTIDVECEFYGVDDRTIAFGRAVFGEMYLDAHGSLAVSVNIRLKVDSEIRMHGWRFWYGTSSVRVDISDAPLVLFKRDGLDNNLSIHLDPLDTTISVSQRNFAISCGECP